MSEPGQVTSPGTHSSGETPLSEINHPLGNLPTKAHQPRRFNFPKRSFGRKQQFTEVLNHHGLTNGIGCTTEKVTTP